MTAWLPAVLRAAGLKVTTYGVRGRPGDYEPHGVLNHHTATKTSLLNPHPTLRLVTGGRPDLPGPLCQVLLGADGHCHVITTGRANHAGKARPTGPMPGGDGNELYIGIEWDYSGYDKPTPAQYAAGVKANAAILTRLRRTAASARGHRETSTTGKWDPGQVDLDALRSDIAAAMRPAPTPTPPARPANKEDDDMVILTIGNSRYRAITGDRYVYLPTAVGRALVAAGTRHISITPDDERVLADQLLSEASPALIAETEESA